MLNIYLLSLDHYIYKLKNRFNENNLVNLKKKVNIENLSLNVISNQTIKIHYARYADNILFGFFMNKLVAKKIINKIQNFMKSDLDCQELHIKSKLIHGISKPATFLNFKISLYPCRYNYKPQYLIRFYKFKAHLQRKKINESKKYLKLQKQILLKFYEKFNHFSIINSHILKNLSKANLIPTH